MQAQTLIQSATPHQIATELSDIRREITRLQRREHALIQGLGEETRRPGWPMQRLKHDRPQAPA
jgi:hypothetical protein